MTLKQGPGELLLREDDLRNESGQGAQRMRNAPATSVQFETISGERFGAVVGMFEAWMWST